jgi:hypothetical protein
VFWSYHNLRLLFSLDFWTNLIDVRLRSNIGSWMRFLPFEAIFTVGRLLDHNAITFVPYMGKLALLRTL